MDRSLRRRGQVLVVVGALLGALVGVVLGLAVKDGPTSTAVAVAGPAGGSVLAATPSSSRPGASGSRAAGSGDRAEPAAGRRTQSADRPDSRHGHAGRDGKGDRKADAKGPDHRGDGKAGKDK